MTELVSRLLPLSSDGQVVHGEGRVSGHILLDLEEWRQSLGNLLVLESGACLQENESLAPGVTWCSVDIKLIVLVLIQE